MPLTLTQLVTAAVLLVGVAFAIAWVRLFMKVILVKVDGAADARTNGFAGCCAGFVMILVYVMSLSAPGPEVRIALYIAALCAFLAQVHLYISAIEDAQKAVPVPKPEPAVQPITRPARARVRSRASLASA